MKYIDAPYNFVPLSATVHLPGWGRQVSHDVPFRDGLSGTIPYTLVADTPLLVGGEKQPAAPGEAGQVEFFRDPDGREAIPGSSIRGMLRAVLEIAAFGRMRNVDDHRHGLRDISGPAVKTAYINRVKNPSTGLLRRNAEGTIEIHPCTMATLDHRDLEQWLNVQGVIFLQKHNKGDTGTVRDKYRRWRELCSKQRIQDPLAIAFSCTNAIGEKPPRVSSLDGGKRGLPVFTTQINDSKKDKGKHKDFIFFDADAERAITVAPEDWRDFLFIHADGMDDKEGSERPWPGHWRQRFNQGHDVPVFFVPYEKGVHIGLAYMPKLAWDFSVFDLIRNTSPAHIETPQAGADPDLADLLFGTLGEPAKGDSLKGRVACSLARLDGAATIESTGATILSSPKPTYFPNYLKQPSGPDGLLKMTQQGTGGSASFSYETCIKINERSRPQLRGFKRYPSRPGVRVPPVTDLQESNKKIQVKLLPVAAGTRFAGAIQFHNLKPEELGALIWAITWGGRETLRHGLGMGKPFGMGQVHFEIDWSESTLRANTRPAEFGNIDPVAYLGRFEEHMLAALGDWSTSPQLSNLLSMADPGAAAHYPAQLQHMQMTVGRDGNEFQKAKQQEPPLALLDYALAIRGRYAPAPSAWETKAAQEAEQQQREAARLLRDLPEQLQALHALEKAFADDSAHGREINTATSPRLFWDLVNSAGDWPLDYRQQLRTTAADIMARYKFGSKKTKNANKAAWEAFLKDLDA